ncbi:MAG: hypothetical protein LC122_05315 [Chitinophagales bacterium]|nr:hypothetical protein [Chitinophagales bacterium]
MKKVGIILLFIIVSFHAAAQKNKKLNIEQVITINGYSLTNLSKGMTNQGGFGWQAGVVASYKIGRKNYIELGLLYEMSKHFINGYFITENGKNIFKEIPIDYRQHVLYMNALQIPLLIKIKIDDNLFLGGGIMSSIYYSVVSKYKIEQDKYEVVNNGIQKFQLSPILGIERRFKHGKDFFAVGFDTRYQVTSFTTNNSFKPLTYNIRLQFPIF